MLYFYKIRKRQWIVSRQGGIGMEEKKNVSEDVKKNTADQGPQSEEWATEALEEMDDFIESQGIYIRQ